MKLKNHYISNVHNKIRAKWKLRPTRFQMFITKHEQNETEGPIFQIVITKYEQNET